MTYGLFLIEPLPMLRLLTRAHLLAAAYALLPFTPLDGAFLSRRHCVVVNSMTFIVTLGGILLALNLL